MLPAVRLPPQSCPLSPKNPILKQAFNVRNTKYYLMWQRCLCEWTLTNKMQNSCLAECTISLLCSMLLFYIAIRAITANYLQLSVFAALLFSEQKTELFVFPENLLFSDIPPDNFSNMPSQKHHNNGLYTYISVMGLSIGYGC